MNDGIAKELVRVAKLLRVWVNEDGVTVEWEKEEKIACELVKAAKDLISKKGEVKAASNVQKAVREAYGEVEDALGLLAQVMSKSRFEEAEIALQSAGGRRELQGIWNDLTRVSQDLASFARKLR